MTRPPAARPITVAAGALAVILCPFCKRSGPPGPGTRKRKPTSPALPVDGPKNSKQPDAAAPSPPDPNASGSRPVVRIRTDQGDILIELYSKRAPLAVANFLRYTHRGFYDGTVFHKVIKGFIVQGGGYTPYLKRKATLPPVTNEARGGMMNLRGTVALSRLDHDPDSGAAEFFINLNDNLHLDHRGPDPLERGYTVFGRVIGGMDVADRIGSVPTCRKPPFSGDVPCTPIVIQSVKKIR